MKSFLDFLVREASSSYKAHEIRDELKGNLEFPTFQAFENWMKTSSSFETFEYYSVFIESGKEAGNFYFLSEEWQEGCLESRNLGETNSKTVEEMYLDVMTRESYIKKPEFHGLIYPYKNTEFGLSWIMQDEDEFNKFHRTGFYA